MDRLETATPTQAGLNSEVLAQAGRIVAQSIGTVAPAAVLLVARKGLIGFQQAFGLLDPENSDQVTTLNSRFDLASLTKLYTTTAFMRLLEAGYVAIDDPLESVIPEFTGTRQVGATEDPLAKVPVPADPAYAGLPVDSRAVTFRRLLTHTSGLAAWRSVYRVAGPIPPAPDQPNHGPNVETRTARDLAAICQYPFVAPPGAHIIYSDLGLILLGMAVERLAGERLDRVIQNWVLDPLELSATGYSPLDMPQREQVQDIAATEICAWRKRRLRGEVHDENAAGLGGVGGHAGLFSTAYEVAVLGQLYLNGGSYQGVQLLQPSTVAEMRREHVVSPTARRGLGFVLRAADEPSYGFSPQLFGHTGFTGTSLWINPPTETVIVLLTNRVYYGREAAGIIALRRAVHETISRAVCGA